MILNKKERLTRQKRIILDYLKSVKTHPTAEEVYLAVKKQLPKISRGTVYRILNDLSAKLKVQKISTQVSRFDGDTSFHVHFVCKRCGLVFDIFEKMEQFLKRKKTKVGKIENYQVYFYGICKKCSKKPL